MKIEKNFSRGFLTVLSTLQPLVFGTLVGFPVEFSPYTILLLRFVTTSRLFILKCSFRRGFIVVMCDTYQSIIVLNIYKVLQCSRDILNSFYILGECWVRFCSDFKYNSTKSMALYNYGEKIQRFEAEKRKSLSKARENVLEI